MLQIFRGLGGQFGQNRYSAHLGASEAAKSLLPYFLLCLVAAFLGLYKHFWISHMQKKEQQGILFKFTHIPQSLRFFQGCQNLSKFLSIGFSLSLMELISTHPKASLA